ncbi:MAG TPA: CoA-binding protein [Polyangiales bacterium]|nr:CoA-binding protein [Polyangiales bacterium]
MNEPQILDIIRNAKTIAVYGMQDEKKSNLPAYRIPAQLHARGYQILPINPNIESALGIRAFAKMSDLPLAPDILDVFRRSEFIPALADEILALPEAKRPRTVWLQSGITHAAAGAKLMAAGMNVVSDRCLGVEAAHAGKAP